MLDLLGSEEWRNGRELPPTNGEHGRGEISRRRAIDEAETQERTQRRRQELHERGRATPAMIEQVAMDRRCVQGRSILRQPLRDDKSAGERRVDSDRVWAEPLL